MQNNKWIFTPTIITLSLLLLLIFEKQNIPDWQTPEHWFQLHSENFLINKNQYSILLANIFI